MIVLGVDPGTATTGYGVVRGGEPGGPQLLECGVIRTQSRAALASRLRAIFEGLGEVIERHHPDAMAVEDVFFAKNVRTTVVLGHARGVALLAGEQSGLEVHEYAPRAIKKAVVGTGAATKEQVQFMVARLLRLKTPPHPADAADGVACALTCVLSMGLSARLRSARGEKSAGQPIPLRRIGLVR